MMNIEVVHSPTTAEEAARTIASIEPVLAATQTELAQIDNRLTDLRVYAATTEDDSAAQPEIAALTARRETLRDANAGAALRLRFLEAAEVVASHVAEMREDVARMHAENRKLVENRMRSILAPYFAGGDLSAAVQLALPVKEEKAFAARHGIELGVFRRVLDGAGGSVLRADTKPTVVLRAYRSALQTVEAVMEHAEAIRRR